MEKLDHRADARFRKRNKAASKGEERVMWSGRLRLTTHGQLKTIVDRGEVDSQADAVAAAVAAYADCLTRKAPDQSKVTN